MSNTWCAWINWNTPSLSILASPRDAAWFFKPSTTHCYYLFMHSDHHVTNKDSYQWHIQKQHDPIKQKKKNPNSNHAMQSLNFEACKLIMVELGGRKIRKKENRKVPERKIGVKRPWKEWEREGRKRSLVRKGSVRERRREGYYGHFGDERVRPSSMASPCSSWC